LRPGLLHLRIMAKLHMGRAKLQHDISRESCHGAALTDQ
jgi:hypothetical protein